MTQSCAGAVPSDLLTPLFSIPAMKAALSDGARLTAMLAFEAALARSEADAGLVPPEAADAIEAACVSFEPDIAALAEATRAAGNPAIPFVKALTTHCPEPGRGYVHWGSTSQDVLDTAASIVGIAAMKVVETGIAGLGDGLAELAGHHRSTVMPGRTLMQPALPITLGFKLAGWLDMLMRCRANLAAAAAEAFVLQFGGAVGTLAALGDDAEKVRTTMGERLGLPVPDIAWHTGRDRIARLGCELAMLTGALAKMAGDVILLMQAEVDEAAEPAGPGRGGSSTMPQKRNPVASAAVRAAAIRANGLAAALLAAVPQEHERAAGGWQAEWTLLPDLLDTVAGALSHMCETITGIEVDPDRMRANLAVGHGTLMAESLMMTLAPHIGRLEAHHVVEAAAKQAIAEGRDFSAVCLETAVIVDVVGADAVLAALDPARYLGTAQSSVDAVLARWKRENG